MYKFCSPSVLIVRSWGSVEMGSDQDARDEFVDCYLDFAVTCMRIAAAPNISDDDRRDLMEMARYWQIRAGGLLKRAGDKQRDKPKMN